MFLEFVRIVEKASHFQLGVANRRSLRKTCETIVGLVENYSCACIEIISIFRQRRICVCVCVIYCGRNGEIFVDKKSNIIRFITVVSNGGARGSFLVHCLIIELQNTF